ncbi:MAG: hypothetical protein H7Z40_11845 [Phycisphaerae bacterium]|nr:hypothetical protein [Gemmatimonadaceae bacterium]
MKTRTLIVRAFAVAGLCLQPVAVAAQPTARVAVDSVNQHVRSHPKAKKAPVTSAAARTSAAAPQVKAKREVPSIITMPAAQPKATSSAKRAAPSVTADSTPAVRRAPTKAKPPR